MTFKRSCSAMRCINNSWNSTLSFYRFPKDINRARVWVVSCGREDLKEKLEKLHNSSYRLCAMHFDHNMFANYTHKKLHRKAVPTIFPTLEGSSSGVVTEPTVLEQSIKSYQDIDKPISEQSSGDISRTVMLEDLLTSQLPMEEDEMNLPDKVLSPSHRQTQTSQNLSLHTPRKNKLKKRIKKMKNENAHLRQIVRKLEDKNNSQKFLDHISLNNYKQLTYKFCPSRELANFINVQVCQSIKRPKGRRYSDAFKNFFG